MALVAPSAAAVVHLPLSLSLHSSFHNATLFLCSCGNDDYDSVAAEFVAVVVSAAGSAPESHTVHYSCYYYYCVVLAYSHPHSSDPCLVHLHSLVPHSPTGDDSVATVHSSSWDYYAPTWTQMSSSVHSGATASSQTHSRTRQVAESSRVRAEHRSAVVVVALGVVTAAADDDGCGGDGRAHWSCATRVGSSGARVH